MSPFFTHFLPNIYFLFTFYSCLFGFISITFCLSTQSFNSCLKVLCSFVYSSHILWFFFLLSILLAFLTMFTLCFSIIPFALVRRFLLMLALPISRLLICFIIHLLVCWSLVAFFQNIRVFPHLVCLYVNFWGIIRSFSVVLYLPASFPVSCELSGFSQLH